MFAISFFCIGFSHAEDAEEPSVKVMSYNIHRGGIIMHETTFVPNGQGDPVGQG